MDNSKIESFIRKQNVAFICFVDETGCPNVKAMLKPRKIDGLRQFYKDYFLQTDFKKKTYLLSIMK